MNSSKRTKRLHAIETLFCACAFIVSQILVAIFFLKMQQPSPGKLIPIMAAIDATFLLLIFSIALLKKERRKKEVDFGNFAEAYTGILESLQKNLVSRLESGNGSYFEKRDVEALGEASRKLMEILQSETSISKIDPITFLESMLPLLRGLVRIGMECINRLQGTGSEESAMKESMASMNMAIEASLPIVEKIILATEEYEADIATQIFKKFEEIWEYSEELVDDSEKTLQIFSKGEGEKGEGLAYIATKNKEISALFRDFTEVVETLEKNAHAFLEFSIEGLEEILKTIGGIEDMAEKIKVISINVRIEAARDSGGNSGFNVLGQEITSFADQASVFSHRTVSEIEDIIGNLKPLRDELIKNLNIVQDGMDSVENKLSPYNRIIDQGFVQMDNVTKNLNEISVNILNKMKQTIGNLQYQDITNQEAMHIIEILANMKKECAHYSEQFVAGESRNPDRELQIRSSILDAVKSIITTGSETKILEEFFEEAGLDTDEEDPQILADSTNLDDKTILF